MPTSDTEGFPSRVPGHLAALQKVSEFFSITEKQLLSKSRVRQLVDARQILFWICRNILTMSFPDIGRAFLRDHTTIMGACKQVSKRMRSDESYAEVLDRVVKSINPKHRILETSYKYSLTGARKEGLVNISRRILKECERKGINTLHVTFCLVRGKGDTDEAKRDLDGS